MFVLPLSRTAQSQAHRAVAPQIGRVFDRLVDTSFDRLVDSSFDRYFGGSSNGTRSPALDVTETDSTYTLTFDLPGVTREQLAVSVEGRRVSVESTDAVPADASKANGAPQADLAAAPAQDSSAAPRVLYRERRTAPYARTVSLPAEVDQGASQAKFENGVLTLTLAKRVPTGATRLSIG